jgi:hypothetical protein
MQIEGLLKAKNTNDIYAYHGEDKYTNITKGGKGKLALEDAQRLFVIPIQLNLLAERNPLVVTLISKLGLGLEDYTEEEKKEFLDKNRK